MDAATADQPADAVRTFAAGASGDLVKQITTVTIGATVDEGDVFTITVAGVDYAHIAVSGGTTATAVAATVAA